MSETKTYTGGCHCGKIRFEVKGEINRVVECNCSICSKVGWLLSMVPVENFKFLAGEEQLSDYQFGKERIHHLFCPTCGVRSFSRGTAKDGQPAFAVNVRCLEGFDVGAVEVMKFDGKSL